MQIKKKVITNYLFSLMEIFPPTSHFPMQMCLFPMQNFKTGSGGGGAGKLFR